MHIAQRSAAALSLVLLGGCGAAEDAKVNREPPPVEETVFKDMVGTMDKARAVEDTLQQQKEQRDRQLSENDPAQTP